MKTKLLAIFVLIIFSCNTKNYKKIDASKSAIVSDKNEITDYETSYERFYGKMYSDSIYQYYLKQKNNYKITLKAIDIYDERWFTNTKYKLTITKNNELFFERNLENYEAVSLTNETKNCEVEIYNNIAYILYSNGNGEKNIKQNLNLIIVDLKKKSVIVDKSIFNQDYGITNLTMTLNLTFNKLLIAYSDISKSNNESLVYSIFNLKKLNFDSSPKSIFLFDEWEKRNPLFINNDKEIYLCNTTGDEYGFFAYKGKQGLAFSKIDNENQPINYFGLFDKEEIYNQIILNGFVYYKLASNNQEIIKKINLRNCYE